MKTLRVSVNKVGTPKIEAEGFNGVGCKDATQAIEKALSGTGTNDTVLKPEYHAVDVEHEQQIQQQY